MIEYSCHVNFLRFKYPFRIAHGERIGTDTVFVVMRLEQIEGFGEATLPPYLGVSSQDVLTALSRDGIEEALALESPQHWFSALYQIIPDNMPALAALDMARWQIHLALTGTTIENMLGQRVTYKNVPHTFTLGVSDAKEMDEKIRFAKSCGFELFKLKLDGNCDWDMLTNFRRLCHEPFAVDVNQGWTELEQALRILDFLEQKECFLIEQPFNKTDRELSKALSERTFIPIIADEACRQVSDLNGVLQVFDGVNVKLQKCGGITPALEQLQTIRSQGKKALIGCMSESSIGCNAAEQLAFLCDWADLDGPYLNANNKELCEQLGYSL
jgi:L-alanine-DL-glutamate epimerase-like enolase superfamily enzyme